VISISFQIEAARKHKRVPAESLIEHTRAAIGFLVGVALAAVGQIEPWSAV
jgi:hypothetical protein